MSGPTIKTQPEADRVCGAIYGGRLAIPGKTPPPDPTRSDCVALSVHYMDQENMSEREVLSIMKGTAGKATVLLAAAVAVGIVGGAWWFGRR